MPREKECFRDNLERISERFPGKEMLSIKEVTDYTGLDRKTVKKLFEFRESYISIVKLARGMS